jgi:hypothetical protein
MKSAKTRIIYDRRSLNLPISPETTDHTASGGERSNQAVTFPSHARTSRRDAIDRDSEKGNGFVSLSIRSFIYCQYFLNTSEYKEQINEINIHPRITQKIVRQNGYHSCDEVHHNCDEVHHKCNEVHHKCNEVHHSCDEKNHKGDKKNHNCDGFHHKCDGFHHKCDEVYHKCDGNHHKCGFGVITTVMEAITTVMKSITSVMKSITSVMKKNTTVMEKNTSVVFASSRMEKKNSNIVIF